MLCSQIRYKAHACMYGYVITITCIACHQVVINNYCLYMHQCMYFQLTAINAALTVSLAMTVENVNKQSFDPLVHTRSSVGNSFCKTLNKIAVMLCTNLAVKSYPYLRM